MTKPMPAVFIGHGNPMIAYETLGRDAALSIPTPDHYFRRLNAGAFGQPAEADIVH